MLDAGNFKIVYSSRNVNSKRLFKSLIALIETVLKDQSSQPAYRHSGSEDTLQYIIESEMERMLEKGTITQFDVIADSRNNTREEVENGTFHILLKFRQANCLNETKIDFTIALLTKF